MCYTHLTSVFATVDLLLQCGFPDDQIVATYPKIMKNAACTKKSPVVSLCLSTTLAKCRLRVAGITEAGVVVVEVTQLEFRR